MCYKKQFIVFACLGLLGSCVAQSTFTTGLTEYQRAIAQYEAKKYYEAAQLFEKALPQLQGKNDEASAHFYWAYCGFYQKKYVQSASRFKRFRETFLQDPRLEEALYMQGHTLYCKSPAEELDQNFTKEAAYLFRSYLQHYPNGSYVGQVRTQLEELNEKLALKTFSGGKLYHRLGYYRAAVVTLESFQQEFPFSSYNEEAAYLKADAQYRYLKEVAEDEKHEQLGIAMRHLQELLDSYPDSSYIVKMEKTHGKLYNYKLGSIKH